MPAGRRRDWLLVAACLLASALWIDFGKIHRCQNSDSIVMFLTSLYRWTPMYWGQDRYGMFFPFVAMPFTHPLANMLAQTGMTVFVGLSSFFLLGYYALGRRLGIASGAISVLFLLLFTSMYQRFECLIVNHQYLTASAIALAGLVLVDRWGGGWPIVAATAGVACIAIAHWINPCVALALAPLVAVRGLCFRNLAADLDRAGDDRSVAPDSHDTRSHFRRLAYRLHPTRGELVGLAAIVLSLAGSMMLSRTVAEPLPYHFLPPREWLACGVEMWSELRVNFDNRWFRAVELTALAGVVTLTWPAGQRAAQRVVADDGRVARRGRGAIRVHERCRSRPRPPRGALRHRGRLFLASSPRRLRRHSMVRRLAKSRLGRALAARGGARDLARHRRQPRPAVARTRAARNRSPRRPLHRRYSRCACTHVTGDYWHVWPAVFHANLRLYEEHSSRRIWGIADRCTPTERFCAPSPTIKCASPKSSATNRKPTSIARNIASRD